MKTHIKLLVVLPIFVGIIFIFSGQLSRISKNESSLAEPALKQINLKSDTNNNKINFRSICSTPLSIEIANVDKQFKLSNSEILEALQKAINEWHEATGREWFKISRAGTLKVNFLFDGRQSSLLEMENEHVALEKEAETLNINPKRSQAEVASLLDRIDSYRDKYKIANDPVPWAQHHSDQGGVSIDVFAFSDKGQLHATLLHELGHAMGLGHLPQQDSIMYALRIVQNSDIHLSQYDVEAALSLCEKR